MKGVGETAGEAIHLSGAKPAKWIQMSSVVQALHLLVFGSRDFLVTVRGHVSLLGHGVHSSLLETCFKLT